MNSRNLDPHAPLSLAPDEGIVVVGLKQQAKTLFMMGTFKDGRFYPDGFFPAGFELTSGEPYLVQKVKQTLSGDRRYGLQDIEVGDVRYSVTCDKATVMIAVQPGTALYLGDFDVHQLPNGVWMPYVRYDIQAAQAYLEHTYPDQHWTLTRGNLEDAWGVACPGSPDVVPNLFYALIHSTAPRIEH